MGIEINKQYLAELWNDIVKCVTEIPRSVLFWNGLVFLFFIVVFFINPEAFLVIQGIASFLALAIVADGEDDKNQIWIIGTALFWLAIIFVGVIGSINWIGTLTIGKFNDWLDNKKQQPLTRQEKKELWKQQHIQKKKSKRLSEKQ